jgi:hypothetical protein
MTLGRSTYGILLAAAVCSHALAPSRCAAQEEESARGIEVDIAAEPPAESAEVSGDIAEGVEELDAEMPSDDEASSADFLEDAAELGLEGPADPGPGRTYSAVLRPTFWLAWSQLEFGKAPGTTVVTLDDHTQIGNVRVLLPLELLARTENQEFRFKFMHWDREGSTEASVADPISFGGKTFTIGDVDATLNTDVFGFDFLQRIVGSDISIFEFYLMAGTDLFSTHMELSGDTGNVAINQLVPILTVGMGLRFLIREDISFYAATSALSYSQLLAIEDAYFDVRDTFRSVDVAVRWELSPKLSWGAGWKHYAVGFTHKDYPNEGVLVFEEMTGPTAWLNWRF